MTAFNRVAETGVKSTRRCGFSTFWARSYLGDDSDMIRQLGGSSAPAYYLIGPDGKLVGSAGSWEDMEKLVRASLR